MSTTAEAVIIGGGVMGCSLLYNLAQLGMTHTLLLEKDVLASGSTSRSQAILRMHYSNEVTTRLAWESLNVFKDFDTIVGSASGYTRTGYILIVDDSDRRAMEENVAMHKAVGVNIDIISAEAVREIAPMLAVADHEAFAYEPESGYLVGVGEKEYVGPDDYNQGVDMPLVEATCANLAKRIPGMRDALFRGGWSGLFTVTPDWHPILDRIKGIDGLYVAVGFSGHGFKESPMIGLTMAELIVHGQATTIDITRLDAKRFTQGRELKSRYGIAVLA